MSERVKKVPREQRRRQRVADHTGQPDQAPQGRPKSSRERQARKEEKKPVPQRSSRGRN